ncbi:MAG: hypothetical protein A2W91_13580 [Bacteroidetes bacterium GWF2_38_335]|nr:MAG: hypothetical protein A2W91_13580 [Bacteroidetes bacterium GWF2_38_335]OFY77282.1 MAG: hypothetical protein A2281_15245 [Bacteroidetes bacterium RIFOXYA12_FULL_38_20]HBS85713.1 hypothetical protein [Bacteroidales bacterium]
MKKIFLLLLLIPVFILPSCKKGEDDPFLSFRSRDNRVTGSWNLASLIGSNTVYRSDGEEIMYDFYYDENVNDQMTVYYIYISSGVKITFYYEYFDILMDINEDQTNNCSYRAEGEGFYNWNSKGEWYWTSKGKRKEYIDLDALDLVYEGKTEYDIKRLTEKEMVLVLDFTDTYYDDYNRKCDVVGYHTFTFRKVE